MIKQAGEHGANGFIVIVKALQQATEIRRVFQQPVKTATFQKKLKTVFAK